MLADEEHEVVLRARAEARAAEARRALPNAAEVLIADVPTFAAMRSLAEQANASGRFDAVIHNFAICYREKRRDQPGRSRPARPTLGHSAVYAFVPNPDTRSRCSTNAVDSGVGRETQHAVPLYRFR